MNLYFTITIIILISITLFFETIGYIFRIIGKSINKPSLGYSYHVQIATFTRFGTLVSFPLLAYAIESEIEPIYIMSVPIFVYIILIFSIKIAQKNLNKTFKASAYVFKKIHRINNKEEALSFKNLFKNLSLKTKPSSFPKNRSKELKKILSYGVLSFLLISSAFLLSSIVASMFPAYRATILQSAPLISSIGTFISVTFFDPKISIMLDESSEDIELINQIWNSRVYASIMGAFAFIAYSLFFLL